MVVERVYSLSWFAAQSFCITSVLPRRQEEKSYGIFTAICYCCYDDFTDPCTSCHRCGRLFMLLFFACLFAFLPFASFLIAIKRDMCAYTGECIMSIMLFCILKYDILSKHFRIDQKVRENSPEHL